MNKIKVGLWQGIIPKMKIAKNWLMDFQSISCFHRWIFSKYDKNRIFPAWHVPPIIIYTHLLPKIWISDKDCFYKKTFETFHSNFNIFAQPLTHVHSLIRICMTQTRNFVWNITYIPICMYKEPSSKWLISDNSI